jgi:enoyl-CoA hydratase/carnithine racemase
LDEAGDEMYDLPDDLSVTADGPVRLVEMNRPDQLNSASEEMHAALAVVWDRIAADPAARAVVLTGRGRAFSAGGNFEVMLSCQRDPAFRDRLIAEARQIIVGMLRCPLPVVAAVNGPAVGLGCSLALLSDLVLIADDAHLSDPHVGVGLAAGDGGALLLPLLVGLSRAKELLFLGGQVPAQEAVRLGLATRAVPSDELPKAAMDLAKRLAELPAQALQATKRAVNLHLTQALEVVLDDALRAESQSMQSADHIAIVDQIIARSRKRQPSSGRKVSSTHQG